MSRVLPSVFAVFALTVALGLARNCASVRIKPKAPEWSLNLAVLRTAQQRYYAEYGEYVAAEPVPREVPRHESVRWPLDPDASHGFNRIAFAPEGELRCQYAVATGVDRFTAVALCDPDDRGEPIAWGYVGAPRGESTGVPGPLGRCGADGVFDASGRPALRRVGPCDEASARSLEESAR